MKCVITTISVPLFHSFNLSFVTRIVPDKLKIAQVIPIHKNGDKSEPINYRPISNPPTFSELIEKIMADRLNLFLAKNNILNDSQHGFRSNHNTSTALIHALNIITTNLENNLLTTGFFCDVAKAFDSIDHFIQLD